MGPDGSREGLRGGCIVSFSRPLAPVSDATPCPLPLFSGVRWNDSFRTCTE